MPDTPPLPLRFTSGRITRPVAGVIAAVRAVAFWLAITLPVAYPVTLLTALEALPVLLVGHATAVALGHGHRPDGTLLSRETG